MRRPNPAIDPGNALSAWNDDAKQHKPDWTTYSCKLVTPLYGGGVRPGEVDDKMPIRPSGIRGQLRFWWRLACGPFASPAAMFRREAAIWGGIGGSGPSASKVAVRVDQISRLRMGHAFTYQNNPNAPGKYKTSPKEADWVEPYAVFPARGELSKDKSSIEKAPHRLACADLGFRLGMRLHEDLDAQQSQEVQTALRWWASFGGVGARTRRGLGAVHIRDLAPVTREEVEGRGGQLCLRDAEKDSEHAWKEAVGRLKAFRQGLGVGRNPPAPGSQSPAGRSLWPEADTIRELSGHAHPDHARRVVPVDGFPRAAFGLPVVFHFKDAPSKPEHRNGDLDPDDHILEPADRSPNEKLDRMASPLVVRPYWTGKDWRPAALLLPDWEEALGVPLKFKNQAYRPGPWPDKAGKRATLAAQIKPMDGRGDDPLSAFMTYFQED